MRLSRVVFFPSPLYFFIVFTPLIISSLPFAILKVKLYLYELVTSKIT